MLVPVGAIRLSLPDWAVDRLTFAEDGTVEALGWILPAAQDSTLEILVNGQPAETTISDARLDVQRAWAPVATVALPKGFTVKAKVDPDSPVIDLDLSENGEVHPFTRWSFPQKETFPIPDPERCERVCGKAEPALFLRNCYSNHTRIRELVRRYGQSTRTPLRVLDWGSGAGGVARYAVRDGAWDYTGADIDSDNVAWCNENLRPHRFVAIPLNPPTSFADQSFDMIFGISVVTHLSEADQFKWLAELRRILAPDGLCLLSVLGGQAIAKDVNLMHVQSAVSRKGFVFGEGEHKIGQIVGKPLYYGTTYHSESYVRDTWSEWFEIVDYVPAALSHQDMVVMRPR